jgi:hypothetical protein
MFRSELNPRRRHRVVKYPMVICSDHPRLEEPGYLVCVHVISGKEVVGYLERATGKELGVVCCKACWISHNNDEPFIIENFILSCAAGLREKGLLASA